MTRLSGRGMRGCRSLCFIFICAFALVALVHQILHAKNHIKIGQEFRRLHRDEAGNWSGLNLPNNSPLTPARYGRIRSLESSHRIFEFNSTSCQMLRKEILDVKVLTMVNSSELFDRWRNMQVCKWEQNKEEINDFTMSVSQCCNASSFLFTTKRNTPLGTKLGYEVGGTLNINPEIFGMFPDDMPYSRSEFKRCAVVGNGGININSKCGKEIDSADFVFRCNIPPVSHKYSADVGSKTDFVTINPSIIRQRFQMLEKWRRPFYEVLQLYNNASIVLPAFYQGADTGLSFRAKYTLDDFRSPGNVFFFHPQYLLNVARFWKLEGVRARRLSTGLMLVTIAMELCEEVHLYGFWSFPTNPEGASITHHYYDDVKAKPGVHAMSDELFHYLHMHARGILHLHTQPCN
ncbi:alpha-2,8-sialyltransferase 8E-like [Sardina pilchardus]|uniref:alpha-2,8-sialyltransferase 8E-like n=1 Tax=Sardina pilchardus TaxID=27697 RepID=UPI002E158603